MAFRYHWLQKAQLCWRRRRWWCSLAKEMKFLNEIAPHAGWLAKMLAMMIQLFFRWEEITKLIMSHSLMNHCLTIISLLACLRRMIFWNSATTSQSVWIENHTNIYLNSTSWGFGEAVFLIKLITFEQNITPKWFSISGQFVGTVERRRVVGHLGSRKRRGTNVSRFLLPLDFVCAESTTKHHRQGEKKEHSNECGV